MKKLAPAVVTLRYGSEEAARAAADGIQYTLRALNASMDLFYTRGGPVVFHRLPAATESHPFLVTSEFAAHPPVAGAAPKQFMLESWAAEPKILGPMNARHVMIDLETFGKRPGCPVLTLGAVEFGPNGLGEEFYIGFDDAAQLAAGLFPDPETVAWWAERSPEARAAIDNRDRTAPNLALQEFAGWLRVIGPLKDVRIWGNGANFDEPILTALYDKFGLEVPWAFWNSRCYRTLKNLRKDIRAKPSEIAHHALHDAAAQARHAIEILNELDLWATA